jgi:hypothetical protein
MLRASRKRKRILCRFNFGSKRHLSPLAFPVRENRIINCAPVRAGDLDIGTARNALIGAAFPPWRSVARSQVLFSAIALVKVSYLPASLLLLF